MERKKVLIIHETLNGGGAEKVFADVISRFDFTRYDVTLLLLFGEGLYMKKLPEQLKTIILYPEQHTGLARLCWHFKYSRNRMLRAAMARALGTNSYDVIISFLEGPALIAHSMVMDRAARNVSWVHTDMEYNHWTAGFFSTAAEEAALYKRLDLTVFVCRQAMEAHRRKFGETTGGRVILNIIEADNIRARAEDNIFTREAKRVTLCNVGRLTRPKRQDRLIEAVAQLRDKYGDDVEAIILGEGELRGELEALARQKGVEERITFCGFCENPYPYIKHSDIFVLTSESEGFALVVAEAMCLGKPIVSTSVTGPNELLANGAGILTGETVEEIAETLHRLISDPDAMRQLGTRAKERSSMFEPEQTMKQIYSVIEGKRVK